mgnify:CR=1 FL=1
MAPGLASAMSARCAINARAVVSGAKVRRSPAQRRGSRRFGGRSSIVPRASSDDGDGNEPEADGKPFDPTTTNETRLRSIKGKGGPSPDGDDPDPEKPKGPLDSLDRGTLDLINLLVVTGGLKGSIAVVGGALVGINALATIHPDLASLSHGAAFAAPVALLDALVMVPNWELGDDARDEMAKGMNRGEVPDKLSEYRTALAKYQREEALSNPCRSMPGWQDGLVACVARLTDEMLERAVVLGFLGTWIADRAVEAGLEPYDVEAPAMYAAVAACLVFFEVRIQRRRKRAKDAMRAFRVQRDALTGKQKMVPMTDDEVKALMAKGVKEFEKEKTNADDTRGGPGDVPEGMGGVGLPVVEKATVKTEAEVADLVEAVTAEEKPIGDPLKPKADAEPLKPKVPMPPGPPMPLGLAPGGPDRLNPVGSLMFNADVKRTLDGFRSRITLLTQCVCFVTAPALVGTNVPNLFAPIAGGLVCDLLFIAHQRLAMRRLFEDAEYEMPTGGAPPKDAEIKKAQMKLLKKDLDRRRRVMANVLMESVDNSVAEGAAEFNIQMREVVKEVQEAKGYTRQDDALTEVLDAIHKKFPPAKLSEMDEAESVSKMRSVLVEIREELANPKTEKEKEADRVAQAKAELEKDPIDREPWRSLEKTLVEDQDLTHEEAREQMNGVMKKIEEGAAANLERAKQTKEEPDAAKEDDVKEETPETKRTITLGDISELANSSGELPPAKSIFEQAREEKEAEIEAKAKAAELEDEENERTEPTGEFASTISALDRLTAAIDEKLEAKDRSQKK